MKILVKKINGTEIKYTIDRSSGRTILRVDAKDNSVRAIRLFLDNIGGSNLYNELIREERKQKLNKIQKTKNI